MSRRVVCVSLFEYILEPTLTHTPGPGALPWGSNHAKHNVKAQGSRALAFWQAASWLAKACLGSSCLTHSDVHILY